jgi:hypothetical protein
VDPALIIQLHSHPHGMAMLTRFMRDLLLDEARAKLPNIPLPRADLLVHLSRAIVCSLPPDVPQPVPGGEPIEIEVEGAPALVAAIYSRDGMSPQILPFAPDGRTVSLLPYDHGMLLAGQVPGPNEPETGSDTLEKIGKRVASGEAFVAPPQAGPGRPRLH